MKQCPFCRMAVNTEVLEREIDSLRGGSYVRCPRCETRIQVPSHAPRPVRWTDDERQILNIVKDALKPFADPRPGVSTELIDDSADRRHAYNVLEWLNDTSQPAPTREKT